MRFARRGLAACWKRHSGSVESAEERQLVRRTIGRVRGILAVWDVLPAAGEGQPRIVDIGCGRQKQYPWAIGVDYHPYDGVDVVTDLEPVQAGEPRPDDVELARYFD